MIHMGTMRNSYKNLVEEGEGKRPLGRHRNTWRGDVKMVLKNSVR
jgi:hypothetical protein